MKLPIALAVAISLGSGTGQAAEPAIHLKDSRWEIFININKTTDGRVEGRYTYVGQDRPRTTCSGTLSEAGGAEEGTISLAENVEAGDCPRGCLLVLKNNLRSYTEVCDGQTMQTGRLRVIEGRRGSR